MRNARADAICAAGAGQSFSRLLDGEDERDESEVVIFCPRLADDWSRCLIRNLCTRWRNSMSYLSRAPQRDGIHDVVVKVSRRWAQSVTHYIRV